MNALIPFVGSLDNEDKCDWLAALRAALPEYIISDLSDLSLEDRIRAEVAIAANPESADLAQLTNLKWVQSLWSGVDQLLENLPNPHIEIVRMAPPQLADTMAEAVLAWTLYLHRDMPTYKLRQTAKTWRQSDVIPTKERIVTVLGLGSLGKAAVANLVANGFTVFGWSRNNTEIPGARCFCGEDGLKPALQNTSIVVLLLPLTEKTRGLINEQTMKHMPRGSSLINFSRGPIIVTSDLVTQLSQGHLHHAVLDVFDIEPLPKESPLWVNPKITVLPHISAPTDRTIASIIVAKNIRNFFNYGTIPQSIDKRRGY